MTILNAATELQSKIGKASKAINTGVGAYVFIKNAAKVLNNFKKIEQDNKQKDGKSVDKFISTFYNGFLRVNEWEMFLYPPAELLNHPVILNKLGVMGTKTSELPNITFTQQKMGYGNYSRAIAVGVDHDPLQINLIVDSDGFIIDFFERWMQLIYNKDTYEIGYKNQYVGTAEVVVYNREFNQVLSYNMLGVFH